MRGASFITMMAAFVGVIKNTVGDQDQNSYQSVDYIMVKGIGGHYDLQSNYNFSLNTFFGHGSNFL